LPLPLPAAMVYKLRRTDNHANLRIQLFRLRAPVRPLGAHVARHSEEMPHVRRDQAAEGVFAFCRARPDRCLQGLRQLRHQPRLPQRRPRQVRRRLRLRRVN